MAQNTRPTIFPSIVPSGIEDETVEPSDGDDTYSRTQLQGLEYQPLRNIAAHYDDVDGRAARNDLIDELEGKPVLQTAGE